MVKKEKKQTKRKQLDEKIKKLEDDFKENDSHNYSKPYVNWKENLERALWLLKIKRRI